MGALALLTELSSFSGIRGVLSRPVLSLCSSFSSLRCTSSAFLAKPKALLDLILPGRRRHPTDRVMLLSDILT